MPLTPTETALNQLAVAPTPDVLAEMLQDARITGFRKSPNSCPIANYLAAVTDQPHRVGTESAVSWADEQRIPLPPVVGAFIARFDQGDYQALVCR